MVILYRCQGLKFRSWYVLSLVTLMFFSSHVLPRSEPTSLSCKKRSLVMSPRHASQPETSKIKTPLKRGPSKDRDRHLEDARHHPAAHPLPHPPHKSIKKPVLSPKHTPHSHPHGDELPAHTNQPGPIKPSKKVTKTGSRS